jgi:hypothetical protein
MLGREGVPPNSFSVAVVFAIRDPVPFQINFRIGLPVTKQYLAPILIGVALNVIQLWKIDILNMLKVPFMNLPCLFI